MAAQLAGDVVAAALTEEKAGGLDDGHQRKDYAHCAGGRVGMEHTHKKGVRQIVGGSHQHGDDGGNCHFTYQPSHRFGGQVMVFFLLQKIGFFQMLCLMEMMIVIHIHLGFSGFSTYFLS